jgi:hypothetical protein
MGVGRVEDLFDSVREMRLGCLTHVAGDDPARVYRQTIELGCGGGGAGVRVVLTGPAPRRDLQRRAALSSGAAPRRSRADLGDPAGYAVIAPSLEDPLRPAQDPAVVDVLSGGRLELGVRAGAGADESAPGKGSAGHVHHRHAVGSGAAGQGRSMV